MASEINPKFKTEILAIKIFKYVLPAFGGLIFVAMIYLLIKQVTDEKQSHELFLILIGGFLVSGMLVFSGFAIKKRESWLYKVNDIYSTTQPVKKVLNKTEIVSFSGIVYMISDEGVTDVSASEFITLQVSKNEKPITPPINVLYYFNRNISDSIVVVDDSKSIYMGSKMDKTKAKENLDKSIKFMPVTVSVGILIPLVVIALFFYKKSNFTEYENYVKESHKWNTTQGEIIKSMLEEVEIKRGKSRYPGFKALINYRYNINDKTYFSDVISFDYEPSTEFGSVKVLLLNFSEGKTVQVYYNPKNNKVAYLIKADLNKIKAENEKTTIIIIVVFGVALIIATTMLAFLMRARKKQMELLSKL